MNRRDVTSHTVAALVASSLVSLGVIAWTLSKPAPLPVPPVHVMQPVDQPRCFPEGTRLRDALLCPDTLPSMRST